ncbi:MAG: hypothetical protein P8182_00425 [Deltaproteobacteria bacterium]
MNARDRELLNEIQSDFPIEPHPAQVIGKRIGMDESVVLERIG